MSADAFMSEYWERCKLLIGRADPDYFKEVVDIAELDRLVSSVRIPATNLNLARGDTPLPLSSYTSGSSYVEKSRVISLHQEGATVILRSVEQWSPALNRLRIAAEEFFGFESQVNVYLTPASEKSTPPHWDTHDLFVLQIAGKKCWRLFGGERTLPLGDERFRVGSDFVSADREDIWLHPGDTLYLPRGVIHEPVADTYSAHVSVGVHTVRYYDLLTVALRLLAEREGSTLRRGLSPWCRDSKGFEIPEIAAQLASQELLEQAAQVIRRQFDEQRAIDLEGRIREVAEGPILKGSVPYVRRAGVGLSIDESEKGLVLVGRGQSVVVPISFRKAVEFLARCEAGSFSADELPGSLTSDERVALCAALCEIGVLKTVSVTG
ncbi:MAG: cupin domain-containing protein [Vicinamibacterales bacterium]